MTWTRNRVAVTGLGVLAANGNGVEAFWRSLVKGQSGIGPITFFDASALPCRIAGEVKNFRPEDYFDGEFKPRRLARFTQLVLAATRMAFDDARLDRNDLLLAAPIPIVLGVSTSAVDVIENQWSRMQKRGARAVSAITAPTGFPQAAVNAISRFLAVPTQLLTLSTACPAGLDAIATAAERIRTGRAEIAVAGGTDTPITPLTIASFAASRSMSTRNDEPARASRPFDRDRDGGVMAEGAGVVFLENLEHALARGARVYAEITGTGSQSDAPGAEPGSGLADSMHLALANAACRPDQVDYVCAHGPSDRVIDRMETESIKKALGAHARKIAVSSIKGVTGNPLSAAGPLQIVAAALSVQTGTIPPTANYEHPDPQCDLDYVPGKARRANLECVVINSHGIGGTNSSLVLQKVDET
ncbi:MAG: beta-ketoacyl-[acyl-carrier-protein] synthase family protein [Kiritimatiellae bacterium]|nr:beta-ketoacyl-[acyl-carrier-protein] synthase family protein [Kiritimatiellia bacterium]